MEEIKCKQVGQIEKQGLNEMTGRVYGVNGLSPSIRTFCGGGQETKILVEPIVYDGFNGQVRTDSTTIGTITRNVGSDLKRNGQGIIEPVIIEDFYKNRGNRYYDQEAPTIRADRDGLKVAEPLSEYELSDTMKRYINSHNDKYQVSDGKLQLNRTVATPITTREGCARADASNYFSEGFGENENISNVDLVPFRVRKLTERECFRLQGVKDEDFAKIRQNQSKSSCYHLAGDSITTSVLMALFGQMLGIDWRSKVDELVDELQGE